MTVPLHSIRQQYSKGSLDESLVDPDPFKQLDIWLQEAILAECPEPTAMVVATAGKDLRPSSRVVLMKGLDKHGILFFTNYESRKGMQLLENPFASVLFFWPAVERQVRVEGSVIRVPESESDVYFESRPAASRIGAVISPQSREIPNRDWLHERYSAIQPGASPDRIPSGGTNPAARPAHWGGYRLIPDYFEFWQGREDRLHDRIIYRRSGLQWPISRLAP